MGRQLAPVLLNRVRELRTRAGLMLQVVFRFVDISVVVMILSALT
jgi:hypothetical protein